MCDRVRVAWIESPEAIRGAKVLAEENRIELKNLPSAILEVEDSPASVAINNGDVDLDTLNRLHVVQTFERCGKNKTKTAQALGINRRSLYRLLEKFEIS